VKRCAQGKLPAPGIGTDHEYAHQTARAFGIRKGEVRKGDLPPLLGHGLVGIAERAVPEIFAHVSLLEEIFLLSKPSPQRTQEDAEKILERNSFTTSLHFFQPSNLPALSMINTVILAFFAPFCGYAHLIPGSIILLLSSSTSFGSAAFCATRMLPVIPRAVPGAVVRPTPR
jgi:hypothetical protein